MEELKTLLAEGQIPFTTKEPLRNWCTFRIGGPAAVFIQPTTPKEVGVVVRACHRQSLPLLVLGRGSNILFSDKGVDGAILHLGKSFSQMKLVNETTIYCQSGALLTDLCHFAQQQGLSGLEPLFGIPGSVGGAVFMNAGAYGGEMSHHILSSTYVDDMGYVGELPIQEMDMSYRHSAYTENGWIVTGVTLRLEPDDPGAIKERMDDFMNRRRTKQPLEYPSGGSTFKRPEGYYASALIDELGLKGTRVGGAMVSEKHAGFVINVDHASCEDVMGVIQQVQKQVWDHKGIVLETEIVILDD